MGVHGLTHFKLNTFAPLILKHYYNAESCRMTPHLPAVTHSVCCVNPRTRCWTRVGQLGTMGWWSECIATGIASALLTDDRCQSTSMDVRYPSDVVCEVERKWLIWLIWDYSFFYISIPLWCKMYLLFLSPVIRIHDQVKKIKLNEWQTSD